MIWSDNAHKVIAAARFNGSGLVVLVNSKINVTGEVCLACLLVQTYSYQFNGFRAIAILTHIHNVIHIYLSSR